MSRNNSASTRDRSIPRIPLLWLAAALLFTLPPMFGSLVSWVPLLFLLALTLKFWMEPKGYRLRFATLKLLFAVAFALFAIFSSVMARLRASNRAFHSLWFSRRSRFLKRILHVSSCHGVNRVGALFVWVFLFPGLSDCALPLDRLRLVSGGIDPVSSGIFT